MITRYLKQLYIRFKGRPAALEREIRRAQKLHRKTGKHYRVYFLQNRYQSITRQDIQDRKHAGTWGWHVNSTRLAPMCFYSTSTDPTLNCKL